jgi:response regulator RpfG family c-di-GMP phosphodiesterase
MLTLLEAIKSYEHEKVTLDLAHKYETLNAKYNSLAEKYERNFENIIEILATTSDSRALSSEGHSKRVAQYAGFLGKAVKLNEDDLKLLVQTAILHDVGKLGMADSDLVEMRKLRLEGVTSQEIRKRQIESSENLLKTINNYDEIINIIKYQFEEYCGSGPYRLEGENIPLASRIIAIANEFDFLKNKTEKKLSLNEIVKIFEDSKSTMFDPILVETFIKIIRPSI